MNKSARASLWALIAGFVEKLWLLGPEHQILGLRWEASQADKTKESLEMELQVRACAGQIPFEASQDKFKGLYYFKIPHIHWQALM